MDLAVTLASMGQVRARGRDDRGGIRARDGGRRPRRARHGSTTTTRRSPGNVDYRAGGQRFLRDGLRGDAEGGRRGSSWPGSRGALGDLEFRLGNLAESETAPAGVDRGRPRDRRRTAARDAARIPGAGSCADPRPAWKRRRKPMRPPPRILDDEPGKPDESPSRPRRAAVDRTGARAIARMSWSGCGRRSGSVESTRVRIAPSCSPSDRPPGARAWVIASWLSGIGSLASQGARRVDPRLAIAR